MITLPVGIDLQRWADSLILEFPTDEIPILTDPDQWRDWAERLMECSSFQAVPHPDFYPDWTLWAFGVVAVLG